MTLVMIFRQLGVAGFESPLGETATFSRNRTYGFQSIVVKLVPLDFNSFCASGTLWGKRSGQTISKGW